MSKGPFILSRKQIAKDLHTLLDIPYTSHRTKDGKNTYTTPDKGMEILDTIIKVLVDSLARGEEIWIPRFGKFYVETGRPVPNGRDNFGGTSRGPAHKMKAPRKRAKFRPSDHLLAELNLNYTHTADEKAAMKYWIPAEP